MALRFTRLLFTTILSFLFITGFSQGAKYRVTNVPVTRNTLSLKEPWTGGFNAPQFSAVNLNCDNFPDLFVFDRVGDKVLTYLNTGTVGDTAYVYAPEYEEFFPTDLNSWVLIRDYNNDGIPDIFTHANLGSRVYKGTRPGGVLHFELVSPLLMYDGGSFDVNIFTIIDDMPIFADVNRDGDMDMLTYGIYGSTIEYYENQTAEHPGDIHYAIDSFKYIQTTRCWGQVQQNTATNSITLNVPCPTKTGMGAESHGARHAGNTLYNFDYDNDHDVDVLNGNIGYNNLAFLHNCGDSSYATVCDWDSTFPSCQTPVNLPSYPAAFGLDIDNDGYEDLLIAPNARNGTRDLRNVMFYKNTNNLSCPFQYQSDTFLIDQQMEFGSESKPTFFDFNGDGLKDLVIGNYGNFVPYAAVKSALAIYYNTGTATQPQFNELTTDYNSFTNLLLVGASPAFGDLNGDGKDDMLLGDFNGNLHFFKNSGGSVASFPSMTSNLYFGIDVGQFATPFIYDLNSDGLNDLLIGKKDGKLSYFWNFGTPTNPQFHNDSVNKNFGMVNVTQPGYSDGSSQPFVWKETGGALKLMVGCLRGFVYQYDLDVNKLRSGAFTMVDSNLVKQDVGTKAHLTAADLNNDGSLEYVIGNSRGGLLLYSDVLWNTPGAILCSSTGIPANKPAKEGMAIYPNPSNNYFVCEMQDTDFLNPKAVLYNVLGEKILVEGKLTGNRFVMNTETLNSGFYTVQITDAGKTYSGKIVIEK